LLCLDGVAGIYFEIWISHLWAVLRAHFGFYAQIPGTWKLRQNHQKDQFYQSKWLIFRHFLGGSKNKAALWGSVTTQKKANIKFKYQIIDGFLRNRF
jgi:hypothetical protein